MSSISLYFLTFSKQVAKLHKEIQAFQQERKSETERFETYKNEEMKKLRAEKRAFDKYQKASKAFPNKQEREELKELKDEVGVIYDIAFELFAMHCGIAVSYTHLTLPTILLV